jgi:transposase
MQVDDDVSDLTKKRPVAQSLKVTAKDISDYYTKAEYTSFTKPKSGKEKKLRRVRKKEEETDPLEGIDDSGSATDGALAFHNPFILSSSSAFRLVILLR